MNAPGTPAAVAAMDKVELVKLEHIAPSGTHIQALRRKRFDKASLAELAENIKQIGVLQPIVVRPLEGGKKPFELVVGERRWLASRLAGLAAIRATIVSLNDDQVLEVQLVENLQREGLHELEEAEGYDELMRLKHINADAVAGLINKSRTYVYNRTKLLALCPEVREIFYAGKLDSSRAMLLARIPAAVTQRAAMADILEGPKRWNGKRDGEPMTYREAHQHLVSNYMLKLSSAPFDIKDADLVPAAGTCPACPKRTGNAPDLFGDVKSKDVCTDPACFDGKRQAQQARDRKKLEDAGEKVLAGEAAKKIFPHWESEHAGDRLEPTGAYVPLEAETWASGRRRTVADIVGPDYKPTLVQHPRTGKIVKLAAQQAVTKAAAGGKSAAATRRAAGPKRPAMPEIDDVLRARLVALIHANSPAAYTLAQVRALVRRIFELLSTRGDELEAVAQAWKWPKGAFGPRYGARLAPQAMRLDMRGTLLFLFDLVFIAGRWNRRPILSLFKISEDAERKKIIAERAKASAAARAAKTAARLAAKAKATKAKPAKKPAKAAPKKKAARK